MSAKLWSSPFCCVVTLCADVVEARDCGRILDRAEGCAVAESTVEQRW